jgi:hypothetical protein
MRTNLPPVVVEDSANATKLFFDTYGQDPLEFNATEVEAAIAFFQGKGFDRDAAEVTASVILKQAKLENLPVFKLLDTLKGLTTMDLSALIGEILNNNRPPSSTLGFKVSTVSKKSQIRNISA